MTNKEVNRLMNTLDQLEQSLHICQHHDAITGTSKEHVIVQLQQQLVDSAWKVHKYYLNLVDK